MSRIRIIKGKLTEIVEKDYNIYSSDTIVDNSAVEIIENGYKKGVSYGKFKEPPLTFIAKCAIHFRPNKDWQGEFGFDWIRSMDTKLQVDVDYKTIIGSYGNTYATKEGAEFITSSYKYNMCLKEFDSFNCIKGKYYIPKVTLEKDREISLDVISDIEESPDKLHYVYDTNIFELTILKKININTGRNFIEKALKIKCLKSFSNDQSIRIIATKNKKMEKVGEIKILKNNEILSANILIIPVMYNKKAGGLKFLKEKELIKNSFSQALINTKIEIYNTTFEIGNWWSDLFFTTKNKKGEKVMDTSSYKSIHRYLDESFMKISGNSKYSSYIRVYCLPNSLNLNGISEGVGNVKTVLLFQNRDNYSSLTHEIFHAIGLYHTFDNNAQYTFKIYNTDNIMDYTHHKGKNRFTTTNWQWKVLRKNLK